jgi:hypothetical protein
LIFRKALSAALTIALALSAFASKVSGQITVSGNPGALTITSAAAPGAGLQPASDASTTYSITTTAPNQKIVAHVNANLPAGVTLKLELAAPAGASSAGPVSLTTSDTEVVGAIPVAGTYPGLTITYTLSANVSAGVVATTPYSVVFSVVP